MNFLIILAIISCHMIFGSMALKHGMLLDNNILIVRNFYLLNEYFYSPSHLWRAP